MCVQSRFCLFVSIGSRGSFQRPDLSTLASSPSVKWKAMKPIVVFCEVMNRTSLFCIGRFANFMRRLNGNIGWYYFLLKKMSLS